jgi:hypothetical protein
MWFQTLLGSDSTAVVTPLRSSAPAIVTVPERPRGTTASVGAAASGPAASAVISAAAAAAAAAASSVAQPPEDIDEESFVLVRPDLEIEVTRINWLYRRMYSAIDRFYNYCTHECVTGQRRLFVFSEDKFMRLDPDTRQTRESWRYDELDDVYLSGPNSLILRCELAIQFGFLCHASERCLMRPKIH